MTGQIIILNNEVDAVLIPDGVDFVIPAGSTLKVTQALGNSITVQINGNLARITGPVLSELGFNYDPALSIDRSSRKATREVTNEEVYEVLKNCYDPEIPVNIVDLGLVYDVIISSDMDSGINEVLVKMTLTAPGCGMGPILVQDVIDALYVIPQVTKADVELVFDPPWSQEMMTEAAQLELGVL